MASEADTSEIEASLKRKSNDVGWEYGILHDPKNLDKVKCKLCGKVMSGGVHRIKEHIARIPGNVSACPKSSSEDQAKCRNAINEAKNKKRKQRQREQDLMDNVVLDKDASVMGIESLGSTKTTLGPMDKFATNVIPETSQNVEKTMREGWIVDGADIDDDDVDEDHLVSDIPTIDQTTTRRSLRELESDDFESDEEEMNEKEFDFEFESDEEHILEQYGEEEEEVD